MAKLFDGEGNPVEAFTQEEVDKIVAENPELKKAQDEVTKTKADLDAATKQIQEFSGSDKGKNMAALREAKEDLEKKLDEKTQGFVKGLEEIKTRLDGAELDKGFLVVAQGDEELAAKVKAEYLRIVKPEDTDEEKRKKMGDAYRLASGYQASPSVLSRVLGSAGAPGGGANGTQTFKPELVELGKKFGLSPEDFQKFGKKN